MRRDLAVEDEGGAADGTGALQYEEVFLRRRALIESELEGMACMHLTLGRATPEEQAGAGMG